MPNANDSSVYVRRLGCAFGETIPDHGSIVEYHNVAEAAESSGFSEKGVRLCCEGHLETLGGYSFEYVAGVPKRTGNHFAPDETAKYECDRCYRETTEWHKGICAVCALGIDEPVVHICIDTSVAYVRIDGVAYAKVSDVADYVRCMDHDGVTGLSGLEDIGLNNIAPIVPPEPVVMDVDFDVDVAVDYDIQAILDGPDDPGGMIATMKSRKVRRVSSGVVYADCFRAAEAIECEPWRIHCDATNGNPHASGELFDWVDDNTESDGSADYARKPKPTEVCDICDSDDDCPDFENFPWVW